MSASDLAHDARLLADAERRADEARAALERDRTAVADGLAAIRKVIAGRSWLREPSRGSFPWDDERYQREFGHALDEIEVAMQPLTKIAKDWSNCPTDPDEIARARADTEFATRIMLDERKRRVAAERQLAVARDRHATTEREACLRAADCQELRRQLACASADLRRLAVGVTDASPAGASSQPP